MTSRPPAEVAARLRQLRARAGLGQTQLAALIGCSFTTVNRWERGHASPSPAAWQRFLAVEAARSQTSAAPVAASGLSAERFTGLPAAVASFVGRTQELGTLRELLARYRLVTLTGPGGVGKTRLAVETVRALRPPAAVAFVDLAPVSDAQLVEATVAEALGVRVDPGRTPAQAIVQAVRHESLLLLDNCEHLADACARLAAALLTGCPALRVLATSRERLDLDGEAVYEVPPLTVPGELEVSAETLAGSEAAALFLARARERRSDLPVEAASLPAVAQICRRLDGLPLALELAAAWIGALSPTEIAARLDDRFRLLVRGRRFGPARHQTLRAAIQWSYDLLPAREQAAFRRLAVFPADFALDAAQAVCGGEPGADASVLRSLTRLVDASMLTPVAASEERRFRLLETLRAFALEQLAAAGEEDATREQAAGFFLACAEERQREDGGITRAPFAAWLGRERDNLRAALVWFADAGRRQEALRLCCAIYTGWIVRGEFAEGSSWLTRLLDDDRGAPTTLRARSLFVAGYLARHRADFGRARELMQQSVALYAELGDDSGLSSARNVEGILSWDLHDYPAALEASAETLEFAQRTGNRFMVAQARANRGLICIDLGELEQARAETEEAHGLLQELGSAVGTASCLANLGAIAYAAGDDDQAASRYRAALQTFEEQGYAPAIAIALDRLSHVLRRQGDRPGAAKLLLRSLELRRVAGARSEIAEAVASAAILAAADGRLADAALLAALAWELFDRLGAALVSLYRGDMDTADRLIESHLGAAASERARADVRIQGWDEAAATTQVVLEAIGSSGPAMARNGARVLTERERDVLRLVVAGRTNKEIAATLVLSVRTVERHIENLYARTGVHGRAAVTELALRAQLI